MSKLLDRVSCMPSPSDSTAPKMSPLPKASDIDLAVPLPMSSKSFCIFSAAFLTSLATLSAAFFASLAALSVIFFLSDTPFAFAFVRSFSAFIAPFTAFLASSTPSKSGPICNGPAASVSATYVLNAPVILSIPAIAASFLAVIATTSLSNEAMLSRLLC